MDVREGHMTFEKFLNRLVVPEFETVVESDCVDGETTESKLDDVGNEVGIQASYFPNDTKT